MTSMQDRAAGRVALALLAPLAMGAECTRAKIGQPFSKIEFRQGCQFEDLPALISITKLEDDAYELNLADIVSVDGDCDTRGDFAIDGEGCYRAAPLTTRLLTAEEMQRVDEMLAMLEADLVFHPERIGQVCPIAFCAPDTTQVNDHYFATNACGVPLGLELTDASREQLTAMWQSFRGSDE